jgi:DNA repair exonuclease SbcCD ATPase subunit
MPRTGITEPQIAAAIAALQARGETVSKITVRKELGDTGSYGTISAYLQQWRQTQTPTPEAQPTAIPEHVQVMFGKVWATAQLAAEAELAPEREAMAQAQADLKEEMVQAQAENDEAVRVLEVQLDAQATQLAEVTGKEQAAQARIAEMAERIGYLTAKMEEATAAMQKAQEQIQDLKKSEGQEMGRRVEVEAKLKEVQAELESLKTARIKK